MAPNFRHGKNAFFSMSDTGGTTFTASSGWDDCSLNTNVETADITAFGDGDRRYLAGLRAHDFSASGHFATTHEEKLRGMLGNSTASNVVYGPQGNTTGYTKLTAAVILTQMSIQSPVGDKVSVSLSGVVDNTVTSTKF